MYDDFANPWNIRLKWAYLLAVVFALLMPVFYTIGISFNQHGFGARIYEFTFDWYRVVLGDTLLVVSLKWTLYLALATIAATIPMALLSAKFYKRTRRKVAFVALMLSPLFVPADIMGSSLLVFFKNLANGFAWLGRTAASAGSTAGSTWVSSPRSSVRSSTPIPMRSSSF